MTAPDLGTGVGGDAVAVVVVRDGALPLGAHEAVAEAGGRAILVGSGCAAAAADLRTACEVWTAEVGLFAAGRWAELLAPVVERCPLVILPDRRTEGTSPPASPTAWAAPCGREPSR
ncbi:MAG: hypothetical protein NVS3B12_17390 [Acidimicrobiales bacterium]